MEYCTKFVLFSICCITLWLHLVTILKTLPSTESQKSHKTFNNFSRTSNIFAKLCGIGISSDWIIISIEISWHCIKGTSQIASDHLPMATEGPPLADTSSSLSSLLFRAAALNSTSIGECTVFPNYSKKCTGSSESEIRSTRNISCSISFASTFRVTSISRKFWLLFGQSVNLCIPYLILSISRQKAILASSSLAFFTSKKKRYVTLKLRN